MSDEPRKAGEPTAQSLEMRVKVLEDTIRQFTGVEGGKYVPRPACAECSCGPCNECGSCMICQLCSLCRSCFQCRTCIACGPCAY